MRKASDPDVEQGARASFAPAILLLAALTASAADFDPKPWQFRRTLRVHEPDRVSVIRIDRDMYERMRGDLGDIRIAMRLNKVFGIAD